ncbi:hypothetical protein V8G54_028523, partial [Vigna mungo]
MPKCSMSPSCPKFHRHLKIRHTQLISTSRIELPNWMLVKGWDLRQLQQRGKMCLTFQTKENLHPTPTQPNIQMQKLAQTETAKLKLEQLCTYLHLPGESIINGEDCHGGDAKAGHNSSHEVSEPLRPLSGQFLFHSCRHRSRIHFFFFFFF